MPDHFLTLHHVYLREFLALLKDLYLRLLVNFMTKTEQKAVLVLSLHQGQQEVQDNGERARLKMVKKVDLEKQPFLTHGQNDFQQNFRSSNCKFF